MLLAKIRSAVKLVLLNLLVFVLLVALIEGLASVLLVSQWIMHLTPLAEKMHTRYDPELGWVNIPNTLIKDIYGRGIDVRINSQGLREDADIGVAVPAKQLRLVCLGDSFTFGFGAGHNETWCHQLSLLAPKVQTVNMGLGGYGFDQYYLWYKRDGGRLKHDLTLVAVVTDDFNRMHRDDFLGYPKPRLEVREGELKVRNVPVPRTPYLLPLITLQYRMPLHELAVVRLYRSLMPEPQGGDLLVDRQEFEVVLARLVEDLKRVAQERGSRLVLVYLPQGTDHEPNALTDWYLSDLRMVAAQQGVWFIDLVFDFRLMRREKILEMFIAPGSVPFVGADGHYSVKGNKLVADLLYRKLMAIPELSTLLSD